MIQDIAAQHHTDELGRPRGGLTTGLGLQISWQRGPLGRGEDRREPNGCFVETVISAAIDRLRFYQDSPFGCRESEWAIHCLEAALDALDMRTARRELAGTEGTHEGS